MNVKAHILLLMLLITVPALEGAAQDLGFTSSPKGFGLTVELYPDSRPGEIHIISVNADFYGMFSSRTDDPGIRVIYSRDFIFHSYRSRYVDTALHAGAGAMYGYCHDFEKGFFNKINRGLVKNPGSVIALTGSIGAKMDFIGGVSFDIGFMVHPGLHLRKGETNGALTLSLFKNGLMQALVPHLAIFYRF